MNGYMEGNKEKDISMNAEERSDGGIYARLDKVWEAVLTGLLSPTISEKDRALAEANRLCESMLSTEHRSLEIRRLLAEAQWLLEE